MHSVYTVYNRYRGRAHLANLYYAVCVCHGEISLCIGGVMCGCSKLVQTSQSVCVLRVGVYVARAM